MFARSGHDYKLTNIRHSPVKLKNELKVLGYRIPFGCSVNLVVITKSLDYVRVSLHLFSTLYKWKQSLKSFVKKGLSLLVIDGGAIAVPGAGGAHACCQHCPNLRQLDDARDTKCRYTS